MSDKTFEEETAEWLEWSDDLFGAIMVGHFDSKLRELAKACIDRRNFLLSASGAAQPNQSNPHEARYTGVVLGEGSFLVLPTSAGAPGTFTGPSGNRYYKSDLLNQTVRIPATASEWYMRNLLVTVVSVGRTKLEVRFAENPILTNPKSTVLSKYWQQQLAHPTDFVIQLPIEAIAHVFDN